MEAIETIDTINGAVVSAVAATPDELVTAIVREMDAFRVANPGATFTDIMADAGGAGGVLQCHAWLDASAATGEPIDQITVRAFVGPTTDDVSNQIARFFATLPALDQFIAWDSGIAGNGAVFFTIVVVRPEPV